MIQKSGFVNLTPPLKLVLKGPKAKKFDGGMAKVWTVVNFWIFHYDNFLFQICLQKHHNLSFSFWQTESDKRIFFWLSDQTVICDNKTGGGDAIVKLKLQVWWDVSQRFHNLIENISIHGIENERVSSTGFEPITGPTSVKCCIWKINLLWTFLWFIAFCRYRVVRQIRSSERLPETHCWEPATAEFRKRPNQWYFHH